MSSQFFLLNDPSTTEIYTLSLHDALPILRYFEDPSLQIWFVIAALGAAIVALGIGAFLVQRSEEHTSELQSQSNLVCRLLLEKKNKNITFTNTSNQTQHNEAHMLVADTFD